MARLLVAILLFIVPIEALTDAQKAPANRRGPAPLNASTMPLQSNAPSVFELLRTRYRFENDGTGQKEIIARIRILNETGTRQLSELFFEYHPLSEELQIPYLRVRKADGAVVNVETNLLQHPPADVKPQFDLDKKRIVIPGLTVGDRVEYDVLTTIRRPLGAGQFCVDHNFQPSDVLDEQLEVDTPRGRVVKLKAIHTTKAWETSDNRRLVHHWRNMNPGLVGHGTVHWRQNRTPDVQVSSFLSWEEVGHWYEGLERSHRVPSADVKAKADELTKGLSSDLEKVEALYNFTAKKIKYTSLMSLGVGGYVPHPAAETLRNQYGDCKDKVALLSALLEAEGLHSSSVLINPERQIDFDVPSPWPFTHVITMLHIGKEEVWMDPSVAVLPFRMLTDSIRGKEGLVMSPGGRARFEKAPAGSPVPNVWSEEIQGEVNEDGTLEATVNITARGESELSLRQAFWGPVEASWPITILRIVKGIARTDEITEVKFGNPTVTSEPFTLSFRLKRRHSADFSKESAELSLPWADFDLPPSEEQGIMDNHGGWHRLKSEPVRLGLPTEQYYKIVLKLPPSCSVDLSKPVRYEHPGGTYWADYKWDGSSLTVERGLVVTRDHLSARLRDTYAGFRKNVLEDMKRIISTRVVSSAHGLGMLSPPRLHCATSLCADNVTLAQT